MSTTPELPSLDIGPRVVPVPTSVSDEARAYLSIPPRPELPADAYPALDDADGWRAHIAAFNEMTRPFDDAIVERCEIDVERTSIDGVRVAIVRPQNPDPRFEGRMLMNIHGGAYLYGAGSIVEAAVVADAGPTVVAVDYGLPPDAPFPANIDDAVTVYRSLLADLPAERIGVYGTSAGATYTLTTALRLRQLGIALPGALGAMTPQHHLSGTAGDTFVASDGLDSALSGTRPFASKAAALFAGGKDLDDPLISPINGEYAGFPPTYLLSGTRDMLLSSTALLHRRLHNAGVRTELHVFEAMPHGFNVQTQLPEAREAIRDLLRFFDEHLAPGGGEPA